VEGAESAAEGELIPRQRPITAFTRFAFAGPVSDTGWLNSIVLTFKFAERFSVSSEGGPLAMFPFESLVYFTRTEPLIVPCGGMLHATHSNPE
jgi:hypothetical protein